MGAEMTLCCRLGFRIQVKRVIGAGLHTGFATNTTLLIKIDDPIRSFEKSGGGADKDARRIITMITAKNRKMSAGIWKFSLFDILYPCPIHPQRNPILFFAGNGTSMTTDAFTMIYDKAVSH
jgi:hypothetical protein